MTIYNGQSESMTDIYDLLERKYMMHVLLAIRDEPGITKTGIIKSDMGNDKSKFNRIKELIEAGFVTVGQDERAHNQMKLYLTPRGQEVVKILDQLGTIKVTEPVEA